MAIEGYPDFEFVKAHSVLVATVLRAGGTLEDCVCVLFQRNQALIEDCEKLARIAPARYRLANGDLMVYRCPEDAIPIIDLRTGGDADG